MDEQEFVQVPQEKPKKKRTGLKVVALALVCSLVGGAGGALTAGCYFLNRQEQQTVKEATVQEDAAAASAMEEDGKEQAVVNQVVHTNAGDKNLSPQEVYNMNVNAVVGIDITGTSTGTNIWGYSTPFAASGSGFVISEDGYIVTNNHVVEQADTIEVSMYDGTTYEAELIGTDASNDVALLKVDATGLDFVAIGDSGTLSVGDQVAAIGNPLGELTFTMTVGYISATDRVINTDGSPIGMLQTDAAINSGNSGGPLFDMNGNVVGINTAKYSGSTNSGTSIEGIGFAIPINDAMRIVNDLRQYGYVTGQAYLGISVKELSLDATTASYYNLPLGVYVDSVVKGSCADQAGMEEGDIITGLGDAEVECYSDLVAALRAHRAGDQTTISVYRSGQTLELKVTLDEKQPEKDTGEEETEAAQEETRPQQGGGMNPEDFFGEGMDPFDFFGGR